MSGEFDTTDTWGAPYLDKASLCRISLPVEAQFAARYIETAHDRCSHPPLPYVHTSVAIHHYHTAVHVCSNLSMDPYDLTPSLGRALYKANRAEM